MSNTNSNEWNFFQLEPHSIGHDWAKGSGSHQMRNLDMRMSNFGDLRYGTRRSDDYTDINYGFEAKATMEGADAFGIHDLRGTMRGYDAEFNPNPYLWGETVKLTRDEQFVRMGMSMGGKDYLMNRNTPNTQIDQPGFDVSDTQASRGPWVSGKNYPTEGWRSFGGKYDYQRPYDGTLR